MTGGAISSTIEPMNQSLDEMQCAHMYTYGIIRRMLVPERFVVIVRPCKMLLKDVGRRHILIPYGIVSWATGIHIGVVGGRV